MGFFFSVLKITQKQESQRDENAKYVTKTCCRTVLLRQRSLARGDILFILSQFEMNFGKV